MKKWKQRSPLSRRLIVYVAIVLVLVVSLAVWLHEPQQETQVAVAPVEEQVVVPPRDMILYFALSQETILYPEVRQVEGCEDDVACIAKLVSALAAGPQSAGGLVAVLPKGAELHGVEVSDDLVTLDFSERLVNGHPGGSISELLTVYALVDSVAANFPHLRQLQILVDGEPRQTLKGHVDLSLPVKADFSWTRNPEEAELTVPVRGGEDE